MCQGDSSFDWYSAKMYNKKYLCRIRGTFHLFVLGDVWYEFQGSQPCRKSSHSEGTSDFRRDDLDAPSSDV